MAAKLFEVGDVLPATTQLKIDINIIGRDMYDLFTDDNDGVSITYGWNGNQQDYHVIYIRLGGTVICNDTIESYTDYHIIDTSNWSLDKRTVSYADKFQFFEPGQFVTWEDLNAPPTYSVTFEENGGTTVTDLTEQTALPNPLPTPTKANNVFAGWYYDALFTQKANAGDILESNVTLYAKWYTVSGWFSDVADAIREKDGTAETIEVVDFPDRIASLPVGADTTAIANDLAMLLFGIKEGF